MESVRVFLVVAVFRAYPTVRWQLRSTSANGRPAFSVYCASSPEGVCEPFGIQTLRLCAGKVGEITTFTVPALVSRFELPR